ncbi:MAG: response regulator, partial [Telluria sp.]
MATILIVDDRPSNRAFLNALLGFTGHRLLEAEDGAQALTLARTYRPDLIVTDILMPVMDGYELVQQVRHDPELRATRVIFFSAVYAERETQAMAARCGVATVLPKPADPHQILDAINAELGMAEGAAPPQPAPVEQEHERALPFNLCARLAELERLCLALIGERRVETLTASFLDVARRVLHADYVAVCLLDRCERNLRHLDAWALDPELLRARALDETQLPGMLLRARAPLRLTEGDTLLERLPPCHPGLGS